MLEAVAGASACRVGEYNDWRLPSIKELYSLILFSGEDIDPQASDTSDHTLSVAEPFSHLVDHHAAERAVGAWRRPWYSTENGAKIPWILDASEEPKRGLGSSTRVERDRPVLAPIENPSLGVSVASADVNGFTVSFVILWM